MNKSKVKKYIINHFKKLNLKKNDNLVIHSDITSFGFYHKNLPKIILDSLINIVGRKGTIVLPLYNTELNKSKIINPLKDFGKYENSALSIFFFKNYKNIRTCSIFHSHLVMGYLKKNFNREGAYQSFGKKSDFEIFYEHNFKLLLLGCDARQGCTYLHHIEEAFKPKYRENKIFDLRIKEKNKILRKRALYKARKKNIKLNFNKIFFLDRIKKITKSASLKYGKSYLVDIRLFDKKCRDIIKKKPNILLK